MAPNGYDWVYIKLGGNWWYTDAEDLPIESRMKEPLHFKSLAYNEGSFNLTLPGKIFCTPISAHYF